MIPQIFVIIFTTLFLLLAIRKVEKTDHGLILRINKPRRVVGPGIVFIIPFIEKLQRVSVEPLSISLPIQSAITRDEIPIQLQSSLDAVVHEPKLAVMLTRDWRTALVSKLQLLMKDKLEELDFDNLDSAFPQWIQSIRAELDQFAANIGVEITALRISNLSPRTRPE